MKLFSTPTLAQDRLESLLGNRNTFTNSPSQIIKNKSKFVNKNYLQNKLYLAGLKIPVAIILITSVSLGFASAILCMQLLSVYFTPIYFGIGAMIPFLWISSHIDRRAYEFGSDYPSILLAMASSLKVGHPPLLALERSVKLLPKQSLARVEVETFLENIKQGIPRAEAIALFGASINQPDLPLFRSAFALVLDNGGKFAPTLERLAKVSRDRSILIATAKASTATMRMTANILVAVTPILVYLVSFRSDEFWILLKAHPVANVMASLGILIITCNYFILRSMSNFKP